MKIAFIGAPLLAGVFGKQVVHVPVQEVFRAELEKCDMLIVQADMTPLADGLYPPVGGWALLQRLLARPELRFKPVLLTAWNPKLVVDAQMNSTYGQPASAQLLKSPLLRFVPLKEAYSKRNQLEQLFDAPMQPGKDGQLLRMDLERNLFLPPIIHEFLHQFKEKVRLLDPFLPAPLLEELRPQLRQFLGRQFAGSPGSNNAELERQAQAYLEERLPDCADAASFIYQLERLENLIEEALSVQEKAPDELELAMVYIDDDGHIARRLKEILQEYQATCYLASGEEEAEALIREHPNVCAVLCGFRFYERNGRLARRQGYHILARLQAHFPELKYAFLSDRKGLANALPVELRWQWPEFRKWEVIDGHRVVGNQTGQEASAGFEAPGTYIRKGLPALLAFLDLAERDRRARAGRLTPRLQKILNSWLYEQHKDWLATEETALGQQALEMLRAYPACGTLPPSHKGINSKNRRPNEEERQREFLRNRLFLRRLTLGFLQMPEDCFLLFAKNLGLVTALPIARWTAAYCFLSHGKAKEFSPENISKAFSKLGLHTRKDYNFRNPAVQRELLPNEWIWLQNHSLELAAKTVD